eukprot:scaffold49528_cov52-Phaeocystis_antarctica.AAC.1
MTKSARRAEHSGSGESWWASLWSFSEGVAPARVEAFAHARDGGTRASHAWSMESKHHFCVCSLFSGCVGRARVSEGPTHSTAMVHRRRGGRVGGGKDGQSQSSLGAGVAFLKECDGGNHLQVAEAEAAKARRP